MSWIIPSTCARDKQGRPPLKLDQLLEEELINIFRWLKPKTLVSIERVSKKFFDVVAKTFHGLKHIRREEIEDVDEAMLLKMDQVKTHFNAVSFVNRYGPSLQTVPFDLLVPQLENAQYFWRCDENYFGQLAHRFPEISYVGRLNDMNVHLLFLFLKAVDRKNKLRKVFVYFDLKPEHLRDNERLELFWRELTAIISYCPKLDKLKVGLSTSLVPPSRRKAEFVTQFGQLMSELCSKVNRLVLYEKAACALKQYPLGAPVALKELKLVFFHGEYCTNEEVFQLSRFAPSLEKVTIQAEMSALKHLDDLKNLEAIDLTTPQLMIRSTSSRREAKESMRTFLKTVGKRLTKVGMCLMDPHHDVPITAWLSQYCPNITKLQLDVNFEHNLSELNLVNLIQFESCSMFGFHEKEVELFFHNNRALKLATFIGAEPFSFKRLEDYFKRTSVARQLKYHSLTVEVVNFENVSHIV